MHSRDSTAAASAVVCTIPPTSLMESLLPHPCLTPRFSSSALFGLPSPFPPPSLPLPSPFPPPSLPLPSPHPPPCLSPAYPVPHEPLAARVLEECAAAWDFSGWGGSPSNWRVGGDCDAPPIYIYCDANGFITSLFLDSMTPPGPDWDYNQSDYGRPPEFGLLTIGIPPCLCPLYSPFSPSSACLIPTFCVLCCNLLRSIWNNAIEGSIPASFSMLTSLVYLLALSNTILGSTAFSRAALGRAALGRAALGRAALGRAALGSAALGRAALGSAALGRAALGSAASGSAALGSAALGSAALGCAALGRAALGSAASGSAALGSAASGSAALGSAASGSAALGSAALGSAALGSAASGSAASGSAALGSAASGSAALGSAASSHANSPSPWPACPLPVAANSPTTSFTIPPRAMPMSQLLRISPSTHVPCHNSCFSNNQRHMSYLCPNCPLFPTCPVPRMSRRSYLSDNKLSGAIPPAIGALASLGNL
ncbi:unnamed protein product [Closterium sp. NIES-64]|nr:unnamed protein product [Closterium sp. NIES-64]